MYRDHTVAAVIPAYNEEGFVGNVVDDLPEFLDRAYVIDDGSTDDTWLEITQHAADRNERYNGHFDDLVVPISHDVNRGVGGAIKTGYLRATEEEIDLTVVLGGDDQMNPEELTRYLDPIVEGVAEYTKGNRFSQPDDWEQMPRFRLLGNVVLSYLTKVASGYWETMDSQNGYTAISLDALKRTDIEGMYEYYGYCNDLLVRLNVANVRVGDVPRSSDYAYTEGWKSHIDYKEYIPRVSVMLFHGFFRRLRRKYLLQSYNPLAPLYVLGGGVAGIGLAGFLSSLVRDDSDDGSWFLSVVGGVLLFLYAGMLDRADNRDLEIQLEPEADDAADPEESESDFAAEPADPEAAGPGMSRLHSDGGSEEPADGTGDAADGTSGAQDPEGSD